MSLISAASPISAPAVRGRCRPRDQGRGQEREPDQRVVVAAVHDDDHQDRVEAEEDQRRETSSGAPDHDQRDQERERGEGLEEEARRERRRTRHPRSRGRDAEEEWTVDRRPVHPAGADPARERVRAEFRGHVVVRARAVHRHHASVHLVRPQVVRRPRRRPHRGDRRHRDRDRHRGQSQPATAMLEHDQCGDEDSRGHDEEHRDDRMARCAQDREVRRRRRDEQRVAAGAPEAHPLRARHTRTFDRGT